MKKILPLFFLAILFISCSSDDNGAPPVVAEEPDTFFKLKIDGVDYDLLNPDLFENSTSGSVYFNGNFFVIGMAGNDTSMSDALYQMSFYFTPDGKMLNGHLQFHSVIFHDPTYDSFIEYPSYFCQVDDFVIDQVNKTARIKYTTRLYANENDINSYSREIKADIKVPYTESDSGSTGFMYRGVEQYCKVDINGQPWSARYEKTESVFTNEGPYKIEINFANSPTPGSFTFNPSSAANYVRFAKFNTATMTYDYYNTTGQVGYTYREYHGGYNYSFIGTCSFTAVNPLNPSDVIQVTNGTFRSYQQY